MEAKQPKILVFTVAAWNSKVGSNTWASLLEKYGGENIANICIRDEIPDNPVCDNYFSISENKVIKSILNRKIKTGKRVEATETVTEQTEDLNEHNERYVKMKKKRRYSMLLAREIVWKLGVWKTAELDRFLDDFKPDIILHSMEGYIHLNRIIEYAVKKTGAKAVGYIWDDNFTYKQSKELGYKLYRFFQRNSLKRLAKITNGFFAISDMTKEEADEFFGIDCKILTKPLNGTPVVEYGEIKKPLKMLYTGKLIIGRDKTLLAVCEAASKFNGDFTVDVYTPTVLSEEAYKELESLGCNIHKPIPQKEVLLKQKEADVLLFLEDIDGPDCRIARLSFSTKTTDYLSAGKCILAVGYENTAPMQYFIKYNAALTAFSKEEIFEKLSCLSKDTETVVRYAENAKNVGLANHDKAKVFEIFDSTIKALIDQN